MPSAKASFTARPMLRTIVAAMLGRLVYTAHVFMLAALCAQTPRKIACARTLRAMCAGLYETSRLDIARRQRVAQSRHSVLS